MVIAARTDGSPPQSARRADNAGLFEPWRLFFPSALLIAPLNVLAWLAVRGGLIVVPGIGSAAWHGREMLFGYGFAVIAGYLLPAIPVTRVLLLWLLWLAGRMLWLVPAAWPSWLEFAIGAAFPIILGIYGVTRFAAVKRWRNASFPLVMAVLGAAGLAAYAVHAGLIAAPARSPPILVVYMVALLIMIMGGRLVPTATIGVLREAGFFVRIPPRPLREAALVAGMLALLIVDGSGSARLAGLLAVLVALILLLQIRRWHNLRVLRDPEVWPLHLGFLWLAIGCALIGLERFGLIHPPDLAALHALAAGGIGSVTLVMMIRVTRYRTGRLPGPLVWRHTVHLILLVAVILRVAGGWALPAHRSLMLWLSATAWTAAFTGAAALVIPMAFMGAARFSRDMNAIGAAAVSRKK